MEFLDVKRLGKQRIEATQILEILLQQPILDSHNQSIVKFDKSLQMWTNHPAVKMWRGHEEWLKSYQSICIGEWCWRGYTNTIQVLKPNLIQDPPSWLGQEEFHSSHRSNLIRKNPTHYRQFWPTESNDLEYMWPIGEKDVPENND
jgi:hypothetical protein